MRKKFQVKNYKLERWQLILIAILLTGLFFRAFKIDLFYIFEHDQDLYSWIVKDIWVDHHLRLIGQVTSIEGVFIGPLFYYLLIPFYVLQGMDPMAATTLATLVGLFTIFSVYFVFNRFFGRVVGLFGAAIYATSLGTVFFDRWAVPTQPTMLWCVWLLYTVFSFAEGKTKAVIVAAILLGTIWHIHVALLPLIPILIFSFFLSRQKFDPKMIFWSVAIFIILTLPFWIFELKHNFIQTKSLLFTSGSAGRVLTGEERFFKILDAIERVFNLSMFESWNVPRVLAPLMSILLFIFSIYKKFLTKKQIIVLIIWVFGIFLIQMITKNPISEYYVANLTIIPILLVSLFLSFLWNQRKLKYVSLIIIMGYMLVNTYLLLNRPEPWHLYRYKEKVVDYISQDVLNKGYKCITISYIHDRPGVNVGFRYLLWWKGVDLVQASSGAPLYSIVIPYDIVNKNELSAQFNYFGVILPQDPKPVSQEVCDDPRYELLPLLGFTN